MQHTAHHLTSRLPLYLRDAHAVKDSHAISSHRWTPATFFRHLNRKPISSAAVGWASTRNSKPALARVATAFDTLVRHVKVMNGALEVLRA
jgi:hypothetical protein